MAVERAPPLELHRAQRTVYKSPARFKVVVAGRRWGKTQLAKISIIAHAKKAYQNIWYVAPTLGMARGILWRDLLKALPRRWVARTHETRMEIELVNGTLIELKGADNPDSLRGRGLHHIVIDEAQDIDEETWKLVLRPTIASTAGDVLFIGTPKAFNWLYEVYMRGQDSKFRARNMWASWQFPTITSPFIPASEIAQARADMDPRAFRQEFEASFETMSGRVYHTFDRRQHLGDFAFNPLLPIWVGQDFNIDPMSSVIMQPQPNGEVWVVDECILFGSNTQETAEEIERRYWRWQKNVTFYPDPAGANRSHARGESDIEVLRDAGFKRIRFKRKHPFVADRINAVNRMFKSADGSIRMRVDHRCKHTIQGLEQTIYKEGSREVDKKQGFEHPIDALGYCIDLNFPVRKIQVGGRSL